MIANVRGRQEDLILMELTIGFVSPETVQYFTVMACAERERFTNKWRFMGERMGEETEPDSCHRSIIIYNQIYSSEHH